MVARGYVSQENGMDFLLPYSLNNYLTHNTKQYIIIE